MAKEESKWGADKASEMVKRDGQPDGIGNKSNLKDWSAYSKGNSYHPDRAQLQHDIGTEGAAKDLKGDWSKSDWRVPQRKSEGRGWPDMKRTTADNAYTGKGGSEARR